VHALGVDLGGTQVFVPASAPDAAHFRAHPCAGSPYLHCTDQPLFRRPSLAARASSAALAAAPVFLDANPGRAVSPGWVSHYINDGATVPSDDEDGVLAYYAGTTAAKNCVHVPFGPSPMLATVATRKIKKGEELFTSYGCVYWLGVLPTGGTTALSPRIQAKIKESAGDLFKGMEAVKVVYSPVVEELGASYDALSPRQP